MFTRDCIVEFKNTVQYLCSQFQTEDLVLFQRGAGQGAFKMSIHVARKCKQKSILVVANKESVKWTSLEIQRSFKEDIKVCTIQQFKKEYEVDFPKDSFIIFYDLLTVSKTSSFFKYALTLKKRNMGFNNKILIIQILN